jgi:hypothetical protein
VAGLVTSGVVIPVGLAMLRANQNPVQPITLETELRVIVGLAQGTQVRTNIRRQRVIRRQSIQLPDQRPNLRTVEPRVLIGKDMTERAPPN